MQPGTQETPDSKICLGHCVPGHHLHPGARQPTTALCAPSLPGDICPGGSPSLRGEATIFIPATEQAVTARKAENKQKVRSFGTWSARDPPAPKGY